MSGLRSDKLNLYAESECVDLTLHSRLSLGLEITIKDFTNLLPCRDDENIRKGRTSEGLSHHINKQQ